MARRPLSNTSRPTPARASALLAVVHRQPDRGLVWWSPCHPVLLVGRDIHKIPGPHFQQPALELEPGSPFEHQHPLGLILVVPEAIR